MIKSEGGNVNHMVVHKSNRALGIKLSQRQEVSPMQKDILKKKEMYAFIHLVLGEAAVEVAQYAHHARSLDLHRTRLLGET